MRRCIVCDLEGCGEVGNLVAAISEIGYRLIRARIGSGRDWGSGDSIRHARQTSLPVTFSEWQKITIGPPTVRRSGLDFRRTNYLPYVGPPMARRYVIILTSRALVGVSSAPQLPVALVLFNIPLNVTLKRKVSLRTVSHVTFTWGVLYTVGFTW